jgi:DNA-binding response OmpR family regulator
MKILLIADCWDLCHIFQKAFVRAGHPTIILTRSSQALEQVKQNAVDMVVLDITMRVIDGWNVLASLRHDPETAQVPVVMLSKHFTADMNALAHQKGAHGLVCKPILPDELLKVLEDVSRGHAVTMQRSAPLSREFVKEVTWNGTSAYSRH